MESRRVTSVEVDDHGHVKRLINDYGEWSPQTCSDVVADMENGVCSYFVSWAGDQLPDVVGHGCTLSAVMTRLIAAKTAPRCLTFPCKDCTELRSWLRCKRKNF